jgi:hypothetical protein
MGTHNKYYFIPLIFILFSLSLYLEPLGCYFVKVNSPTAAVPDRGKYEENFHLNGTQIANAAVPTNETSIIRLHVSNEAEVQIYCYLYPNSTSNITLLVEPKTEWNVTQIKIGISQEINVTVTNGIVLPPFGDVAAAIELFVQLENKTGVVWGSLVVVILTRGWEIAPWPLVPGLLALVVLFVYRSRRHKH